MRNGQPYWEILPKYPKWFNKEDFNFLLEKKDKEYRILQLGVFTGDASQFFCNHVLKRKMSFLVDVDTWEGAWEMDHLPLNWVEVEDIYDDRMHLHLDSGKVRKLKMTTDRFFKMNKQYFDCIYIDAAHDYESVYSDAKNSFTFIKHDGYIIFDDYDVEFGFEKTNGVKKAIDQIIEEYKDEIAEVTITRNKAILRIK